MGGQGLRGMVTAFSFVASAGSSAEWSGANPFA
jgi:hypothetical protein